MKALRRKEMQMNKSMSLIKPLIFSMALLLSACGANVEYKEVLIPSLCPVNDRERPARSESLVETIKSLLVYIKLLEDDLKVCKGEDNE